MHVTLIYRKMSYPILLGISACRTPTCALWLSVGSSVWDHQSSVFHSFNPRHTTWWWSCDRDFPLSPRAAVQILSLPKFISFRLSHSQKLLFSASSSSSFSSFLKTCSLTPTTFKRWVDAATKALQPTSTGWMQQNQQPAQAIWTSSSHRQP